MDTTEVPREDAIRKGSINHRRGGLVSALRYSQIKEAEEEDEVDETDVEAQLKPSEARVRRIFEAQARAELKRLTLAGVNRPESPGSSVASRHTAGSDDGSAWMEEDMEDELGLGEEEEEEERGRAAYTGATVQFLAATFYASADQAHLDIDVVRIGDDSVGFQVDFRTEEGSAKAGRDFVHTRSTLHFGTGVALRTIRVQVLSNPIWTPSLEFALQLAGPTNHVRLGMHLHRARLWVINMNRFPSSRVHLNSSREFRALEFYRLVYNNPIVRVGTIKWAIIDQMHTLLFIWRLILEAYLVDRILDPKDPEALVPLIFFSAPRRQAAIVIGAAHILPLLAIAQFDLEKCWYGVGGAARKELQVNLLRKYLNYSEASRKRVGSAGYIEALYRDSVDVVDRGYCQLFPCFQACHSMA